MQFWSKPIDRTLLACGVAVAPVFYAVSLAQLPGRPDFDLRRMPLSYLSIGQLGFIQSLDFLITGALALACAFGLKAVLRGGRGGSSLPLLVGLFGLAMAAAGVFGPDPLPASRAGPVTMTPTAAVHMAAFMTAFVSLIVACCVSAWANFKVRRMGWATYSLGSAILPPVFIGSSAVEPGVAGILVAVAGLVLFGWLSVTTFALCKASAASKLDVASYAT